MLCLKIRQTLDLDEKSGSCLIPHECITPCNVCKPVSTSFRYSVQLISMAGVLNHITHTHTLVHTHTHTCKHMYADTCTHTRACTYPSCHLKCYFTSKANATCDFLPSVQMVVSHCFRALHLFQVTKELTSAKNFLPQCFGLLFF